MDGKKSRWTEKMDGKKSRGTEEMDGKKLIWSDQCCVCV
jgi:hypothetical protein